MKTRLVYGKSELITFYNDFKKKTQIIFLEWSPPTFLLFFCQTLESFAKIFKFEKSHLLIFSLVDGSIEDKHFPGFDFVIKYLCKLQDTKLVWRYVDWAMNIDQEKGVKIFTDRSSNELINERMRPEIIVDYLKNSMTALIIYLEYLVFNKQIQVRITFWSNIKSILVCFIERKISYIFGTNLY